MHSSRAMGSILISSVLATGVVGPSSASIIQVPSAFPTIQAGINAAAPGDTVQVGPGTYTGSSNRNLDFGGKNIVLRSSAGAATTIIDCQTQARAIRFHTGETAASVVQGFTIRNGLANATFGGGILVENGARPTIRACRLESNHANTGGGIFVASGVTLTDCDFEDNSADNNGGGAYGETADLQVMRCSFTQNTAASGAGVAFNFGATVTLTDCTFTENQPVNLGGGVHARASSIEIRRSTFLRNTGKHGAGVYLLEGSATVDSCTFNSNTATYSGGGLHGEEVDPLTVTKCTFQDNASVDVNFQLPPFGGGGLYLTNNPDNFPEISDCDFIGNRAVGDGTPGAAGGGMREHSRALVERCRFIGNTSDDRGGGAHSIGRFHDCIFEGNSAPLSGGLDGGTELIDCRFTDNHCLTYGGAVSGMGAVTVGGTASVVRCEFSENSAGARGGALYLVSQVYSFLVEDSRFLDNSSGEGGGVFIWCQQATALDGCTFVGNAAYGGGVLEIWGPDPSPPVTISGSTVVGNLAAFNGNVLLKIPVEIANTIIAFGTQGEAVSCEDAGVGVMSCTDIFGNAGGDWTACIADQVGINGNFSLDPRFCNVGGRDFTLAQTSPCTAANAPAGCGLIGAYPVGCATPIGIADAGAPSVTPILRVTPNPVRGSGTIEWSGGGAVVNAVELRLYDVGGRVVTRHTMVDPAAGRLPWSTLVGPGGVPSGVYFLRLGEEGEGPSVRLVVVR